MSPDLRRQVRFWRAGLVLVVLGAFTVVVGYYVPLRREAARLDAQRAHAEAERASYGERLAATERQLASAAAERERLALALEERERAPRRTGERLARLRDKLRAQYGRLEQAKMLSVSSAADRMSVAVAMDVLFPEGRADVTKNGRLLLCQLGKSLLAEFEGQIRLTGYYGAPRIQEPELARRYASPWALSAARAASAAVVLEQECGVPAERFLVVAYGPRAAGPLGPNIAFEFILEAGG